MSSLLREIAEEHRDFENWCGERGYSFPTREYWKHPNYQEWEDYLDPPEEKAKREKKWNDEKNNQIPKVGCLDLDYWYSANVTEEKCPKCDHHMIKIWGFLLTDQYGCPKCGHTEGGEW